MSFNHDCGAAFGYRAARKYIHTSSLHLIYLRAPNSFIERKQPSVRAPQHASLSVGTRVGACDICTKLDADAFLTHDSLHNGANISKLSLSPVYVYGISIRYILAMASHHFGSPVKEGNLAHVWVLADFSEFVSKARVHG